MRKIFFGLLVVFGMFLWFVSLAQQPSKELVIIGSNKYFKHIVQRGETVYTISLLYNVSDQEIIKENTALLSGLRLGQVLLIPQANETTIANESVQFLNHTVEKGQTLYFLARKYDVGVEDIQKYNPQIKGGSLSVGQVVKIPHITTGHKSDYFVGEDDHFIYHKVTKDETLSGIAVQYSVAVDGIKQANRGLNDNIQVGQTIKVPKIVFGDETKLRNKSQIQSTISSNDPLFFVNPVAPCDTINYAANPVAFNVAIFLPFYLDDNEKLGFASKSKPENNTFHKNTHLILDFYEGILMAADTLRKDGLNLRIHTYDTNRDPKTVEKILENPDMANMDLIIGPVYKNCLKPVTNFAKQHEICVVSPLLQAPELLNDSPLLFQVKPSDDCEIDKLVEYLTNYYADRIIAVSRGTEAEDKTIAAIKQKLSLKISQMYGTDIEDVFKTVDYKQEFFSGVQKQITTDSSKVNFVIVPSNDPIFVTEVVGKLHALVSNRRIILFGNSLWKNMTSLEVEYLCNLNTHYFEPYYVDYNKPNVIQFVHKFRNLYKTEPTSLSFLGYDVLFYFSNLLRKYGKGFHNCIVTNSMEVSNKGMMTPLNFRRLSNFGGFENDAVIIIRYDEEFNSYKVDVSNKVTPLLRIERK